MDTFASASSPDATPPQPIDGSAKRQFLEAYEREHATTMRVLRAYPTDQLDLRPHPSCRTARELAWVFALESGLGAMIFADALAAGPPAGEAPPAPDSWEEILSAIEQGHRAFADLVRSTSDADLLKTAKFFVGPQTMGDVRRIDFAWFLLSDEIHHRGQFSIYLRMAGGKVPSIYGPSGDEPWM
jgi:uncharacterized damage-inducible protein DinB